MTMGIGSRTHVSACRVAVARFALVSFARAVVRRPTARGYLAHYFKQYITPKISDVT
jgi:hypothetical protein